LLLKTVRLWPGQFIDGQRKVCFCPPARVGLPAREGVSGSGGKMSTFARVVAHVEGSSFGSDAGGSLNSQKRKKGPAKMARGGGGGPPPPPAQGCLRVDR